MRSAACSGDPAVIATSQRERVLGSVPETVINELPGGPGDAAFDWRVQAKQRGLEGERLETLE